MKSDYCWILQEDVYTKEGNGNAHELFQIQRYILNTLFKYFSKIIVMVMSRMHGASLLHLREEMISRFTSSPH